MMPFPRSVLSLGMLATLAVPSPAQAFCGTYVGGSGEALLNRAASVVMARQGERTTLTLAMDYEGDASSFALLLPVPEVLTAEDVRTVDPALLNKVAQYATPRMVSYTCDDVAPVSAVGAPVCAFSMGCSDAGKMALDSGLVLDGAPLEDSVEVEAAFSVAAYEIVVLSAEESGDLEGWLGRNGYEIPAGGREILQEYIDAGSFFLAAKVTLETLQEGGQWLPPLQFGYDSPMFALPIRIGTISSPGEQEVVIYTLTDDAAGAAGISNYPEAVVEDECMPRGAGSLGEVYPAELTAALGGEAGWVREHAWSLGQLCDPCTLPDAFTAEEIGALGFVGASADHYGSYLGFLTALRVRYTPEQATQDLVLYTERSGGTDTGTDTGTNTGTDTGTDTGTGADTGTGTDTGTDTGYSYYGYGYGYYGGTLEQTRFIRYAPEMEAFFPICGEGYVENPGTCWEDAPEGGCQAAFGVGGPLGSLATLVGLAVIRRRRGGAGSGGVR